MNSLVVGNLAEETVKQCELAQVKIKDIRSQMNQPLNFTELFSACEFLMSFRAWLTYPILESEAKYRDKVAQLRQTDISVAAAEVEGKTSEEYRAWKYLERIDDLANEQILLVKKLSERLGEEFRGSAYA